MPFIVKWASRTTLGHLALTAALIKTLVNDYDLVNLRRAFACVSRSSPVSSGSTRFVLSRRRNIIPGRTVRYQLFSNYMQM